ncbi:MAG: hypothetical protein CVV64_09040 [Candidatus Wallbacteria bacterium HGW-Wallbacteria-1]|jgi:hypothetical protein|uniref:Uncharacterized protein n=1 Tax=Candidatus Wallbacteria bacterium HGW-Wallbacteria-1 TaxID=2013854 RepID=A0A2N1PQ84_9BACT|nr:MAG: hypothetical protein CVV64_09040 [Candidatus Wallbacteria bacterium HGW-Wallbacteria-1]
MDMKAAKGKTGYSGRMVSVLVIFMIVIVMGVTGCGSSAPEAGHDTKAEDKKDDKKKKKSRAKKPSKRKRTAKSGSKSGSSSSGSSSSKSSSSKKRGKVSVDDLLIKNPGRIEDLLKSKDYTYKFKYNIFRDFTTRKKEKFDYDKDGIPDIYDLDDDNDGFSDAEEIAQNFDPLNKFHHPERNTITGPGGGNGLMPTAPSEGGEPGVGAAPTASSAGKSSSSGSAGDAAVGEGTGVYFRGLFGVRSAKIAALKVVKDKRETMLLCREGETFKGVQAGKEYLMEEINLSREFIRVKEITSGEVFKLSFQKKENKPTKVAAAEKDSKGSSKNSSKTKKRAKAKPKPKKKDTKKK